MKTLSVILLLTGIFSIHHSSNAQKLAYLHSVSPINESSLDNRKTSAPTFIGGYEALCDYLNDSLEYPYLAKVRGVEGQVLVEFVINEAGEIEDLKLVKSLSGSLDQEALRLVRKMPKWNPALQNGVAKSVKYQLPIQFSLN